MATPQLTKPMTPAMLTEREWELIELLRKLRFGRAEVVIVDGQADRVEKITENVKLTK